MNVLNYILTHLTWFWLGMMVLCVAVEALTMQLTTVWAAVSALVMIFVSRTGLAFSWQLVIFLVLTILLVVLTRPLVLKKLNIGKNATNINSMEGQEVLVTKAVSKFQKGEAKATNGVVWTVTSQDGEDINVDYVCQVVGVEGNTLIIKRK